MPPFQLSAQLAGHEADVRGVAFPSPDAVLSASRDRTVRRWRRSAAGFDSHVAVQGTDYINSIAFIPPSAAHPEGLVASGGRDTIIDVRRPSADAADNAERLLVGHAHNVCALDAAPDGRYLVSGGWDGQARVWSVDKWETEFLLQGHDGTSVWAVLALDATTVITGCADKNIRIFDLGRAVAGDVQPRSTIVTPDIVRALCRLPDGHPSGAKIASAHNDGVLRLWRLNGQMVAELPGHESFVYSLAALPSGEIISSAEDRTVRVWRGDECVQTITHPAISVWCVAACPETGDVVSGASDGVARVFTRSAERVASADALAAFEESIKASAIPQQQVGGVNKEKLPGPDFVAKKAGTKEGQVQMIREDNGSVSAYTWSMAQQEWVNVGTVVDSAGSSGRRVEHEGKEYDYVFDVDIEDGKPPLKLPYNLSENPYERARKFLEENKLPLTYLDNVVQFIEQNTKGATLGDGAATQQGGEAGGDEERAKKVVPQGEYLSILGAKHEAIVNKILSVNANMISSGRKDAALNPTDQTNLKELRYTLQAGKPADEVGLDLVLRIVTRWDYADRLPGLDLLRCTTGAPLVAGYRDAGGQSIVEIAIAAATEGSSENCIMMALRAIANLFGSQKGREVAAAEAERVLALLESVVGLGGEGLGRHNRNVLVAAATVVLNYAVLGRKKSGAMGGERKARYVRVLERVLAESSDAEVCFRGLVALGTLLYGGVSLEGVEKGLVSGVGERVQEERVSGAVEEVLSILS